MNKQVVILSGSPRKGGNSDTLCEQFQKGCEEAGHMKKAAAIFLSAAMVFLLVACNNTGQYTSTGGNEQSGGNSLGKSIEEGNILIAYFSVPESDGVDTVAGASRVVVDGEVLGNNQYVAQLIQEEVGGDLFRIETVQEYPGTHDALLDFAYTFLDTAEVYGTSEDPHANERLVGEALVPYRDQVVVATKFGLRFDFESGKVPLPLLPDSRPDTIRKAVEGSLKRLQTDHIDLYFQHRIDPAVEPEEVAGVMSDLIREGKITHWGISEANEDYLRRAHAVCPVTAVQNRYSMMARRHEALFPVLEELGVGLVAFSPMANGFLTGQYGKGEPFDKRYDYRATMPQFTDEAVEKNQKLLELLHAMAEQKNATPAQISLAWMLCKKPWIVPIPGTRKPERMRENAGAAEINLTAAEVKALDEALDGMKMSAVYGEKPSQSHTGMAS